ncbi:MAG TPA: transketolase, partial [Polyangiaceae bacterium]|nr:transketolase [Polyangiaceae bacterium]
MTAQFPSPPFDTATFDEATRTVRFLSIDAVEKAQSGHPGAPMGLAAIAVELFTEQLTFDPSAPNWPGRDRFVLSCGHASMLIYSMLHLSGYDLSLDDLKQFRQWGSKTPGHPEYGHTPGVETTTGPLGQGIGNSVGLALASKLARARLGASAELLDYRVFTICSDGDVMEGVAYEAASLAGHLKLDNLVVIYDANNVTIDGKADVSLSEDVGRRFEGLGWVVSHVDGHDAPAVHAAVEQAKLADRPALIVARTHIGFGSPGKQDSSSSHGSALGAKEVEATKKAAGWPLEPTFIVPERVREAFAGVRAKNKQKHEDWQKKREALPADERARFEAVLAREVPADLLEQLVASVARKDDATRNHSGKVLQKVAELVPALVGGSADLAGSVKTTINGSPDVSAANFAGKNLHFGVREHGMGSVMNGLALSGLFVPYGSTFLIFGDYMRPPMRLAGLMNQQVLYVFSHDSVFLGEDGPTHQPVEQLWT